MFDLVHVLSLNLRYFGEEKNLPYSEQKEEFLKALKENQALVLVGEDVMVKPLRFLNLCSKP
uniref:Uncharacterized protein n=1 Tax=Helianthus annuus TaxID=4232 RepID=A0A251TK75_HELAN